METISDQIVRVRRNLWEMATYLDDLAKLSENHRIQQAAESTKAAVKALEAVKC